MKILVALFLISLTIMSCKDNSNTVDTAVAKTSEGSLLAQNDYHSYGEKISADGAMTPKDVAEKYANLKEGDTAIVKFAAPINAVCAAKGCWMRMDIAGDEEVFVKFKDYAFFVPTDTEGEAIVAGKAYLEEVSVDELRHMAEDAGKSKEDIAAITKPERELRFMANGVLIKSK